MCVRVCVFVLLSLMSEVGIEAGLAAAVPALKIVYRNCAELHAGTK